MNEVTIPLKISGIAQMKAELRELKGAIANATDPTQMTALAQRAGEVADKLKDANEQVAVFTAGSKFESISNSFAGVRGDIASLDFEGANEKAKVFAKNLGSLNPKDISKGLKDLTGTLGTLGKAFVKLGLTILMNPIFLIVAAVVAIIAVVALVLKSFGVLDDVIAALMAPINALIAGFKTLTDWLGLTAYAAEDNAAKTKAAMDKSAEATSRSTNIKTEALDRQIAIDKASGKSTLNLEIYKANIIIAAARSNYQQQQKAYYAELALGKNADQKELQRLRDKMAEERKIILDQGSFKIVAKINEDKEIAKKEKPVKDKPIKAAPTPKPPKAPKAVDTGGADIQKIIDETIKANLNATLDAITVEKNAVEDKYTELIAKAKKYGKNIKDLEIAKMNALNDIDLKERDKNDEATKVDVAAKKVEVAAAIKLEDEKYLEIKKITAANETDKAKQIQLNADYEISVLQAAYDEKTANLKEGDALLIQLTKELSQSTADITKEAKDKEVAITKEAEEKKRAEQFKTANEALDFAANTVSAIEGITNLAMENKLKKVKKGSKEEEALLKKQFQLNKSMQLAGAIVDAGKAITASLASSPIAIGPIPNPAGIASLAFASITAATNIAKIASTTFTSGTAPSSNTPTPSTTAVAPSGGPNLFGQANTGSQVNAGGSTSQNITVTAIVSETEITASQNHINNIQNNSVL